MKNFRSVRRAACMAFFFLAGLGLESEPSVALTSPRTLSRTLEPVALTGRELPRCLGARIEDLRVLAFAGGRLSPIPFQVDERDGKGEYVMTGPDGSPRGEDDGLLDENDEVVFMVKDAGDRLALEELPKEVSAVEEVCITDPLDGGKAWAYVAAYSDNPPPLSPISYMKFTHREGHDEVVTPAYALHFPSDDVFFNKLIIREQAGGNGKNLLDKVKMRSGVDLLGDMFSIKRTEGDFRTKVVGYRAGPVRVIRRTDTRLVLLLTLKSPSVKVNTSIYPYSFQVPSMLSLPFRMDLVASDAFIRQGWDLNRNALGMKFYTNLAPEPAVFDGKMSEQEKKLAASREILKWGLCTGPQGTFMFRGVWDESMPVKPLLYYEDNLARVEMPENDPGVMGFAYKLVDLLKLGGDTYPFDIINYIVPRYQGDLEPTIKQFTNPPVVKITKER